MIHWYRVSDRESFTTRQQWPGVMYDRSHSRLWHRSGISAMFSSEVNIPLLMHGSTRQCLIWVMDAFDQSNANISSMWFVHFYCCCLLFRGHPMIITQPCLSALLPRSYTITNVYSVDWEFSWYKINHSHFKFLHYKYFVATVSWCSTYILQFLFLQRTDKNIWTAKISGLL